MTTKKAATKKPAATVAAKKPAPKTPKHPAPHDREYDREVGAIESMLDQVKANGERKELRPQHQAFVDALSAGSKAYGTIDKAGNFGGWLTIAGNGNGKSIRVSYRLCQGLVKEVGRKDRIVEFGLA